MSPQKRALAALSGLLMTLLCVLGGSQAALAYDDEWQTPGGTRVTSTSDSGQALRAALADRGALTDQGALANPGVTPAPESTFANITGATALALVNSCPTERFCTYQRLDNGNYTAYDFYRCADYHLSNWKDVRSSYNRQTPGTTVQFLGQNGGEVDHLDAGQQRSVNYGPVWTIRLCT